MAWESTIYQKLHPILYCPPSWAWREEVLHRSDMRIMWWSSIAQLLPYQLPFGFELSSKSLILSVWFSNKMGFRRIPFHPGDSIAGINTQQNAHVSTYIVYILLLYPFQVVCLTFHFKKGSLNICVPHEIFKITRYIQRIFSLKPTTITRFKNLFCFLKLHIKPKSDKISII